MHPLILSEEVVLQPTTVTGRNLSDTDVTTTRLEDSDGNEDIAKLTATIEKSYTCKVCQKQFRFKSAYNRHTVTHAIVGLHQCNLCKKYYKRLDTLRRHSSIHIGGKNYKCLECGKTYTHAFNLKHHMATQHDPNFKKIKCYKCNKSFNDARNLRYHDNRVHTFKTPYVCHCGKAYHAPNELYQHSKLMNHMHLKN